MDAIKKYVTASLLSIPFLFNSVFAKVYQDVNYVVDFGNTGFSIEINQKINQPITMNVCNKTINSDDLIKIIKTYSDLQIADGNIDGGFKLTKYSNDAQIDETIIMTGNLGCLEKVISTVDGILDNKRNGTISPQETNHFEYLTKEFIKNELK